MGRVFDWLDRKQGETVRAYDNRINSLAAFHAGYAFFSLINYEKEIEACHVYNVWNGEFNSKLALRLPPGGFMLHCDRDMAERLSLGNAGYPVFIKLKAKLGRLYAAGFFVTYADTVMDMYFNGCEVIPPEYIYFRKNESPEDSHHNEIMPVSDVKVTTAGSRIWGSFRRGSYPLRRGSSLMAGSFIRVGGWNGSFLRGSFTVYGRGSYKLYGAGTRGFGTGSFNTGSFVRGSFRIGMLYFGSFRVSYSGSLINGSYYMGSYHRGSFVYGGGDGVSRYNGSAADKALLCSELPDGRPAGVRRLIEELGYGLDLI